MLTVQVWYACHMVETSTHHGTVVVERAIAASVSRVYAAFADHRARATWGAPSDSAAFFYEEADFRVGGRDVARCGSKDNPQFVVETQYVDITPQQRIVWTEIIRDCNSTLSTNITTLEFRADEERTRLKVTVHVTSFVGEGMIANTESGHIGSIADLVKYLETS